MQIAPIGHHAESVRWRTLHFVPSLFRQGGGGGVAMPATPQAVPTETARMQAIVAAATPMIGMLAVAGNLEPPFQTVKVGATVVAVSPIADATGWGFS